MNMKMSVWKGTRREKREKRPRRALDSLDAPFGRIIGKSFRALSRIRTANAWPRERRRGSVAGEARTRVCRTLLRDLREQENNTKEPRVSIKDDERDYDGVLSPEDDWDDAKDPRFSSSRFFF